MSDPERVDPFAGDLDLSDFKPAAPKKPKIEPAMVREVSEANNFPSRAASKPPKIKAVVQRRRRTGRNVQFNIKATPETIARFTAHCGSTRLGVRRSTRSGTRRSRK